MQGQRMGEDDWGQGYAMSIGIFLNGMAIPNPNPRGDPALDDMFYIIFNAHHESLEFKLPEKSWGTNWLIELDTASGWIDDAQPLPAQATITVQDRSVVVLRQPIE